MRFKLYVPALSLLLLLNACAQDPCGEDKDSFLTKYAQLMDDAAKNTLPASDPGWKARDEQFRRSLEECYDLHEAELSGREKRKFWMDATRYYINRYGKGGGKEVTKQALELSKLIRKKSKSVGNEVEDKLNEWSKNLEKMSKGLESWLEEE